MLTSIYRHLEGKKKFQSCWTDRKNFNWCFDGTAEEPIKIVQDPTLAQADGQLWNQLNYMESIQL